MLGEALSIGSAFTWALAVVLFKRGLRHSPEATNLFKNVFALVLLGATFVFLDLDFPDRPREHWIRLGVSGILGIAVADTIFFASLKRVGAGFMGVLECAYAPFVVLFSVLLLDESLTTGFLVGAFGVIGGVILAGAGELSLPTTSRDGLLRGVLLGVGSIGIMGFAIVLAKPALEESHVVEATITRLAFGTTALLLWITLRPGAKQVLGIFQRAHAWRDLSLPAFVGTYLTMLLWIGGMKYADASVSGVLCQLSTIFTLALGALILRERLTPRHWAGGGLALCGALAVVWLQAS